MQKKLRVKNRKVRKQQNKDDRSSKMPDYTPTVYPTPDYYYSQSAALMMG